MEYIFILFYLEFLFGIFRGYVFYYRYRFLGVSFFGLVRGDVGCGLKGEGMEGGV